MFIPRTLARTEGPGRGSWARAVIVGTTLALAIFAVLSVDIGNDQVNLAVGDVATTDITAPRTVSFISDSQWDAARQAAADAVEPVYEPIAPLADIREAQLRIYDRITRTVRLVLLQRDSGSLTSDEALLQLAAAAPAFSEEQITLLATLSVTNGRASPRRGALSWRRRCRPRSATTCSPMPVSRSAPISPTTCRSPSARWPATWPPPRWPPTASVQPP